MRLGRWTDARRAEMSAIHRKRCGAPEGHSTIYGIHVPHEHSEPLRYWAEWFAGRYGRDEATYFVEQIKAGDWQMMPAIRDLWTRKLEARFNRKLIREIEWEAYRANQDCR